MEAAWGGSEGARLCIGEGGKALFVKRPTTVELPAHALLRRWERLQGGGQGEEVGLALGGPLVWSEFKKLCGGVHHFLLAREHSSSQGVQLYSSVFDPQKGEKEQREQLVGLLQEHTICRGVEELVPLLEEKLLLSVISLAQRGGYNLLLQDELLTVEELAMENARLTRPIEVDWDALDPSFLSAFLDRLLRGREGDIEEAAHDRIPEFSKRVMVCWKGVTTKRMESYFGLQKFDILLQKLVSKIGLDKLSSLLHISSSSEASHPLSGHIQLSANELVRRQRALRRAEQNGGAEAVHDRSQFQCIERETEGLGCGLEDFLKKDTVEEVVFEELLLVYRPGHRLMQRARGPSAQPRAAQAVHIQRFANVPLRDFASVFPSKKRRWNFADCFYVVVTLCWSVTLLFKLQHAWASSTYLDELALAVLFVLLPLLMKYVVTSVLRFRSDRQHEAATTAILYNTSLNCNKAALTHVREQAVQQELNVAIAVLLALYFPLGDPAITLTQLQLTVGEVLFKVTEGAVLSCDLKDALDLLQRLGILGLSPVGHNGDFVLSLSPLPIALESVRHSMLDEIGREF